MKRRLAIAGWIALATLVIAATATRKARGREAVGRRRELVAAVARA